MFKMIIPRLTFTFLCLCLGSAFVNLNFVNLVNYKPIHQFRIAQLASTSKKSESWSSSSVTSRSVDSFFDLIEKSSKGSDVPFEKFRGKVVYGVNVASYSNISTSEYAMIAKLLGYKEQGVEVAIFPCNQFDNQEPDSDAEIEQFCALHGAADANLFAKGDVNGPQIRPTYRFLKDHGILQADVPWNFAGKFIVSRAGQGNVI